MWSHRIKMKINNFFILPYTSVYQCKNVGDLSAYDPLRLWLCSPSLCEPVRVLHSVACARLFFVFDFS